MILLFACARAPIPLDEPGPTEPPNPVDRTPPFGEPALAEDLDPDPAVLRVALTAARRTYAVGGRTIEGYAYDGQNPGPTLKAKVGDTLVVELTNELDVETTIHWHGVAVPYAMDGVTWQADPVAPGETFTYEFPLPHAGTFWYHPHFDSAAQVDLGLYGLLVVEDPAEPPVDRDLALVFDDWTESDELPVVDRHGLQLFPGVWAVNGLVTPRLTLEGGEVVRARILNASNTRYLDLAGVHAIALDQGLLSAPVDGVVLAPGDRAELEWLVGSEAPTLATGPYSANGGASFGEEQELLKIEVASPAAAPGAPPWPFDGAAPSADPGATDIVYVLTGDDDQWLINGEAFPDVTVERLALGSTGVIEVRNLSSTEHPFHLHGLSFEVLSIDGEAPPARRIEDTVNVPIRSTVRLLVQADNAGEWMAHCHLLPHAHEGMMTVLRVD